MIPGKRIRCRKCNMDFNSIVDKMKHICMAEGNGIIWKLRSVKRKELSLLR